jgi:DNA (cytosine-5)-methyltransferase 1
MKTWPTPQASDNRDRGNMSDSAVKRRIEIGKQIGLSTAVKPDANGGSLNPPWVEWLMGWPLGWTDLKPLETDKCRNAPLSHGEYSAKE